MQYLDFELEIGQGSGKEYPVAVLDSPGGEAREVMRFPFDQLALESRLKDVEIALLRSAGLRRLVPTAEAGSVQSFGRALFDALFTGEVRTRYDVSSESAARDGRGLRVKLRIQDPALAALPWEFLFDPRQHDFVCLSRNTPLVRYLELPQRTPPLKISPPLRILGVVASPCDLPQLDLSREKERVTRAVADASVQGLVELCWMQGQTVRDLQREMQSGPWHVLHFVGHGGFDKTRDEGLICLCEDDGHARLLHATDLARLLADHRTLRLAVLNACEGARGGGIDVFSSTSSVLVRRGLPAVVAMQYEITDNAAIALSRGFYEAVARGLPVDAAVSEARKSVSLEVPDTVEWATPVLTMRTPDGVLFDVTGPSVAQPIVAPAASAPPELEPVPTRVASIQAGASSTAMPAPPITGVSPAPAGRVEPAERQSGVRQVSRAPEAVPPPSPVVAAENPQHAEAPVAEKKVRPKASKRAWLVLAIAMVIATAGAWAWVVANKSNYPLVDALAVLALLWGTPGLVVAASATVIVRRRLPFLELLAAALAGASIGPFLQAALVNVTLDVVANVALIAAILVCAVAGVLVLNLIRRKSRKQET